MTSRPLKFISTSQLTFTSKHLKPSSVIAIFKKVKVFNVCKGILRNMMLIVTFTIGLVTVIHTPFYMPAESVQKFLKIQMQAEQAGCRS